MDEDPDDMDVQLDALLARYVRLGVLQPGQGIALAQQFNRCVSRNGHPRAEFPATRKAYGDRPTGAPAQ